MSKNTEIQVYELGYLLLPSIAEENLGEVVKKLKDIVVEVGGKELDGEEPFKQDLVYTMSKTIGASKYVTNDAYLGWFKFEIEPSKVSLINSKIEKIDEVLRSLLIKAPRETFFTFAKAKEAIAEKAAALEALEDEVEPEVVKEPMVE